MAGQFHRLTVPAYYTGGGPFPADPGVSYDYLNNAGGGTPSNADGQKVGGPNAGTYLVAFGEDATSNNANRPAKALGENTDHLDDLLHRDLAVAVRTSTATGPSSSVVLPANTYLGPSGTTNNAAGLSAIFEILDSDDNEVMDPVSGNKCQVSLATLSGGDAIGSGSFSANAVTLTISPAIPTGVDYRVYYGTRSNLATLPTDALTFIKIRGAQEVDANVQDRFRLLQGNNLAWDAPWTSTIYDLQRRGLDGVYRQGGLAAPAPPAGYSYLNESFYGSGTGGTWVARDGQAVSVVDATVQHKDPFGGLFVARSELSGVSKYNGRGAVGFVASVSGSFFRQQDDLDGYPAQVASFLSTNPIGSVGWDALEVNPLTPLLVGTYLPSGLSITLSNVGAYDEHTGEAIITIQASAGWFRTSDLALTWLALGVDLLEIQFTQGTAQQQTVVPVAFGASDDTNNIYKVSVRYPNGRVPDWTTVPPGSATLRYWHKTNFAVNQGGLSYRQEAYGQDGRTAPPGMLFAAPPIAALAGAETVVEQPRASFFAGRWTSQLAQQWDPQAAAVSWGSINYEGDVPADFSVPMGAPAPAGHLLGDGSVIATRTVARTVTWASVANGSSLVVTADGALGSTFLLNMPALTTTGSVEIRLANMLVGQEIYVIANKPSATATLNIDWFDSDGHAHAFSSPSDRYAATGSSVDVWVGKVIFHGAERVVLWRVHRYGAL